MLNSDYFTIHPAQDRSRSRTSTVDGSLKNRYSIVQSAKHEVDVDIVPGDISDIASLMQVLKLCRIDREKMEAVESFIEHGGDDLYYLRERMHDIMRAFIFQASRRLLLTHITKIYNEAVEREKHVGDDRSKKRVGNLEAALVHADEEVQRLEYWSDVKNMAERGHTKGAVDESQGWDSQWAGLDDSGPKDAISDRELLDLDKSKTEEGGQRNGVASNGEGKGKGRAKE